MTLCYGQPGTSDPLVEALGEQLVTLRRTYPPKARLYKKDPYNQYMWIEITDISDRKTYIAICYFAPINSNFYH